MLSVETVGVALAGYILGSIPFGVLVAKRAGVDIFSVGSGNPGATNVLRSVSKPAGYLVFFMDFLKGLIATTWFLFPWVSFSGDLTLGLWGLPGAVLGHTYPIFTRFRGGKGVATTMGGLLGVMPGCLILGLVSWLLIFFSTRYVALASIGFGLSLPVCAIVNAWSNEDSSSVAGKMVLAFVIMSWIVWRHRSNITRLRAGTENRFQKKSKN
ncbi:MAG: glycerol-3-phosphate 1-O-acyltransferase PlsY [Opitutales bacterium]|jgi:glycerol-3-phosphate acyltransferase PlsY|tara:strand:- start:3 stop:638 length:636 start_codon:yes stop_codon:yes gene_type:complete